MEGNLKVNRKAYRAPTCLERSTLNARRSETIRLDFLGKFD